jgi:hypothetical protein
MARQWNDAVVMAAFGVVSVGVVVLFTQSGKKLDRPDGQSNVTQNVKRLKDESDAQYQALSKRLDQIASKLQEVQLQVTSLKAQDHAPNSDTRLEAPRTPNLESPAAGITPSFNVIQEALNQGLTYISKRHYDPSEHNRVLGDLATAYAVKGLPKAINVSLKATLEQVNDIGLEHLAAQVGRLPREDSIRQINEFTRNTAHLTRDQITRANALASK